MINRISKKNIYKNIVVVFLASSFALLSFHQLIYYKKGYTICTIIISFVCAIYFIKKTWNENYEYIMIHLKTSVVLFFAVGILVMAMYQAKGVQNLNMQFGLLSFRLFRFRWWLITIPALFYLLVWLWRKVSCFLIGIWSEMDDTDRKIYMVAAIVSSVMIIVLYKMYPQWYLNYDVVYSIDSRWCYKGLFPDLSYYDIRHPILGIITYPMWILIRFMLRLFVPTQLLETLCVSCIQIINIQLLLLIGFVIEKLSGSRWTLLLYMTSFPSLLFALFFEKYQICTFLLVLYAYLSCRKGERSKESFIIAVGVMPTSAFLAGYEIVMSEKLLWKIKRFCFIFVEGVLFIICTGRIHLLNFKILLEEVRFMAEGFGLKNLPIKECFISLIKMIQGSFVGLSSVDTGTKYIWTDTMHNISVVGVVILILIAIGIASNRKEAFISLCSTWTCAAIVLFIVFQWSVQESPLFSIYFSWALVPLFEKGLQTVIKKMHWQEEIVFPIVLISMLAVNILNLIDIGLFLQRIRHLIPGSM